MYKAIIEGKKTQTRRICPIQPKNSEDWKICTLMSSTAKEDKKHIYHYCYGKLIGELDLEKDDRFFYYKYLPNEIIYIKEPYAIEAGFFLDSRMTLAEGAGNAFVVYKDKETLKNPYITWKNPLFMPEKYARLFLRIKKCRIERVQTISNEDCLAEGIYKTIDINNMCCYTWNENDSYIWLTPQNSYATLFDKINGKGSYEANPYVFVYEFEIEERK
ncbi:MAG: hypothetical protein LBL65_05020 [Campylobacteraceae bacterium]|jgi:hypothetical protein|nr:hypothetical protein [Campylobacteraceae bacterium]